MLQLFWVFQCFLHFQSHKFWTTHLIADAICAYFRMNSIKRPADTQHKTPRRGEVRCVVPMAVRCIPLSKIYRLIPREVLCISLKLLIPWPVSLCPKCWIGTSDVSLRPMKMNYCQSSRNHVRDIVYIQS